jgi:hypothetical protein
MDNIARRKRHARRRAAKRSAGAAAKLANRPSQMSGARETSSVARYMAEMTAQLEAMATAVDLDLLAYFLGMARAEAQLLVQTTSEAVGQAKPAGDAEPDAGETRNDDSGD